MEYDSLIINLLRKLDKTSSFSHHCLVHLGTSQGEGRIMLVDPVLLELAEVPREVEVDHGQDRDQEEHQVLPHVCPSQRNVVIFHFPRTPSPHLFPERKRYLCVSVYFAAVYCIAP